MLVSSPACAMTIRVCYIHLLSLLYVWVVNDHHTHVLGLCHLTFFFFILDSRNIIISHIPVSSDEWQA